MQLSVKYSRSISWIVKQRDEYIVDIKAHNPRTVNLVCDATFYGKRKEREACPWGTILELWCSKILNQKRYLSGSILKVNWKLLMN